MYQGIVNISKDVAVAFYVNGDEILIPFNDVTSNLRRCRNRNELGSSVIWDENESVTDDRINCILWDIFCNHPVISHYQKSGQRMPDWFMAFKPKFDKIIKPKQ